MKPSYASPLIFAILMSSLLCFGVSPEFDYTVEKFAGNPIISTQTFIDAGLPLTDQALNINGPSLIRVPDWVPADERPNPAAQYYLYFSHHNGQSIRMAWSEQVTGPYTLYNGYDGVLSLPASGIYMSDNFRVSGHIASPDVIVDEENKRFIMYFHSYVSTRENSNSSWVSSGQRTVVITSTDALNFNNKNYIAENISGSYLRYFTWNGHHYGLQRARIWYAPDGNPLSVFIAGIGLSSNVRHSAVVVKGDKLGFWYSRHTDIPERILFSEWKIGSFPTTNWQLTDGPIEVIRPEYDWEGVNYPIQAGTTGSGTGVHQLRDPGYFQDIDGKEYLLYTGSGEEAIGIAFLSLQKPDPVNYYAAQLEFTDSVSGETIEGLEMILHGSKYITDAQGMISIPEIPGGSYKLTITDSRFILTGNPVIEIRSDSLFHIKVKRIPRLTLRVINRTSGASVNRASVIAEGKTYPSDASGFVNIGLWYPGAFIATVEHRDYFQVTDTFLVLVDTTILIPLTPIRANVTFSFSGINGPVSNVKVTLSGPQYTNSSGEAHFFSLPARKNYSWSAEKTGYHFLQDSFHLETDTTLQVTMELATMVQKKSGDTHFLVYPNPAHDYLVIDKEIPLVNPVNIELVNVSGISVYSAQDITFPYTLRLKGINPGIYFLRIHSPGGFANQIITVK